MNGFRHELMDDETVLISCRGSRPMTARVSISEAKRFAWALLSDLDPEEAFAAGLPDARTVPAAVIKRAQEWRPGAWQRNAVRAALEDGPMNTALIASRLGIGMNNVAVQMNRLRAMGLVQQLTKGRPGYPSLWRLTPSPDETSGGAQ